ETVPVGGFQPIDFSNPAGLFELSDVVPGSVSLYVGAPGYREAIVSGIAISEGQVHEEIVVSLRPGSVLSGRVVDAFSGEGIAGAVVSWQPERPGAPTGVIA